MNQSVVNLLISKSQKERTKSDRQRKDIMKMWSDTYIHKHVRTDTRHLRTVTI